uniref:YccF domain-containing protein n=1 Tax=Mesocestoides corti TaxID=53468 RepID=A0A5K3FZI3_MESCO
MASFCPGIIYSVVWFLLAFFIGWPVAGFIAGIYIFLMPFAACIPPIEKFLDLLLKLVKLPLTWSKKGVAMAPLSDCSLE